MTHGKCNHYLIFIFKNVKSIQCWKCLVYFYKNVLNILWEDLDKFETTFIYIYIILKSTCQTM
jgi:hypothetical protein